ncbi:putative ORFan [Tupanvirus deep ocean]|uniref:ORFan n=2 Tax=Tupanvirus TaxID=2094720 RepID=A0AC62A9T8_9VIRU|nr:putative ORFan [Tupanvirus deep ocean]QKU34388.1 putative ORFan [Tupanvirus deep ocean]
MMLIGWVLEVKFTPPALFKNIASAPVPSDDIITRDSVEPVKPIVKSWLSPVVATLKLTGDPNASIETGPFDVSTVNPPKPVLTKTPVDPFVFPMLIFLCAFVPIFTGPLLVLLPIFIPLYPSIFVKEFVESNTKLPFVTVMLDSAPLFTEKVLVVLILIPP